MSGEASEVAGDLAPVLELQTPLRSLIRQLSSDIAADRIGIIAVDDASGRVPALILREAINTYRLSRGLPKLPIVFVPGGAGSASWFKPILFRQSIREHEERLKAIPREQYVLYVTDTALSGQTARMFAEAMNTLEVSTKVAIVGTPWPISELYFPPPRGVEYLVGEIFRPKVDGNANVSGVEKRVGTVVARTDPESRRISAMSRRAGKSMAAGLVAEISPARSPLAQPLSGH